MKIGVTGIFASGKGTVCAMFGELGARIIDTDILARQIVEPGSRGLHKLVKEFGKEILGKNGDLNRREFANTVFSDPEKVKILNSITHPLILEMMNEIVGKAPEEIYMINTPLLFESDFYRHMDANIVVTAGDIQVIQRGIKRDGISEKEIRNRLNFQISLKEKVKKADYVIDNSGSLENTRRQVIETWTTLQQKRKKK